MKPFLLIPTLLLSTFGYSQLQSKDSLLFNNINSLQIELAGHGLAYSINYQRVLINRNKFKTLGQIGIAYYPPKTGLIQLWIPVIITEMRSFGKHHAELGAGYVLTNETEIIYKNNKPEEIIGGFVAARVGYRFQKPDGRFVFRINLIPIVHRIKSDIPSFIIAMIIF